MAEATDIKVVGIPGQSRPVRNVISYLRTLDGSAHPSLDSIKSGVIFDSAKSIYVVEPPIESLNNEAEHEAKLFAEALQSYEAEVPKKYKTGVDIGQPHSIADIIKQIDSSLDEYKNGIEKSVWHAIRKGFRRLGESHEGLKNWLQLLPSSSDYTSLIYGGINLILVAAKHISDVRSEAFKALEDIPYHLESTRESIGIFDHSEALRKCGVRLYTVTLGALGHILKWFKSKALRKVLGAFVGQGSYQSELRAKIAEIETVSTRFKDISMSCLQRGVANTERTVTSLAIASAGNHIIIKEAIDQQGTDVKVQLEQANQALELLRFEEVRQHQSTQEVLSNGLKAVERRQEDQSEVNKMTARSLNELKSMLESIYAVLPLYEISKEPPPTYIKDQEPQIDPANSSRILSVLEHEEGLFQTDLLVCLRGAGQMSRSDEDRAVWAMKSRSLYGWLTSTASSSLLLNGSCPSNHARSPVTFVCARLVESLESNPGFLVLHFFCGRHLSSATDRNATPLGMMNSLLAQLLILYPNFEISNHDLVSVSSNTLSSVLLLFSTLVSQLPPAVMLFLVVDSISLYEDAARLPGTREVMGELTKLAAREEGPVVKVLLTSPTRIRNLTETMGKVEVLSVPRNVPPQSPFSTLRSGKARLDMN